MEIKNEPVTITTTRSNPAIEGRSSSPPLLATNAFSNENHFRRRFANDPDMMYELHRYRKLMLLTILPSIGADYVDGQSALQPKTYSRSHHITPTPPIDEIQHSPGPSEPTSRSQDKTAIQKPLEAKTHFLPPTNDVLDCDYEDIMHSYSYLTANGDDSDHLSRSVGCIGSGSALAAAKRKQVKSANSEHRLPIPGKNAVIAPDPNPKSDKRNTGRRYSTLAPGSESGTAGVVNGQGESDTSELDLLTLAELYLESRHRVFGDEWHQRQNLQSR